MSEIIQFENVYAEHGQQVRSFEKGPDISRLLVGILCQWEYSIDAVIGSHYASCCLRAGEATARESHLFDLIFEFVGQHYLEIILRDESGLPFYGGWLVHGVTTEVSNEIVNRYRVVLVDAGRGQSIRHEFEPGYGYKPVPGMAAVPVDAVRRINLRKAG